MTTPAQALKAGIVRLYESEEYTDFTIICGPYHFSVHRAVFGRKRRRHYAKGCDAADDSEESCDDPNIVKLMVSYFYHQDYLADQADQTVTIADFASCSNEDENRDSEYDVFGLSCGDKKKYMRKKPSYSELPSPPPATTSDAAVDTCMLGHAKIFALAVKYQIPALKTLATAKFQAAINVGWVHHSLGQAITTIYTLTPDDVTELRDIVAVTLTKRESLLERPEIEVAVCNINTLAYRLLKMSD